MFISDNRKDVCRKINVNNGNRVLVDKKMHILRYNGHLQFVFEIQF